MHNTFLFLEEKVGTAKDRVQKRAPFSENCFGVCE